MRPLIGITASSYTNAEGLVFNRMYNPVARAIDAAGGLPVYIPTGLAEDTLKDIYERIDALLLPGGPDIDPSYFGEAPHPTITVDAPRDALEVPLARWAVADDTPVFGICRGHQVFNVALGGSLIQDIPSLVETEQAHDQPNELPRSYLAHEVKVDPNSRLAGILGSTSVKVNSLHHQAVGRMAPGVTGTAQSPDGIVEAAEMPSKSFALTVQWHPEDLWETDEAQKRVFEGFVAAARERAAARR